jgi:hypothetical protein
MTISFSGDDLAQESVRTAANSKTSLCRKRNSFKRKCIEKKNKNRPKKQQYRSWPAKSTKDTSFDDFCITSDHVRARLLPFATASPA